MLLIIKIIAIDIVLSGDNAVVIAMATRNLPDKQQNKGILFGTIGAVVIRILLALVIVELMKIPYVNVIGGILLLWISYKVLVGGEENVKVKSESSLLKAICTIIAADAIMSLDNVVALAGASNGHIGLIAIGVTFSIPIMIFFSKLIVQLMNKYSWIAYIGSGILAWTGANMLFKDEQFLNLINLDQGYFTYFLTGVVTITVVAAGYGVNRRASKRRFHHSH
ncbi:TerC family protein [Heyndrickxia acidicola]|uniref:TerC family protein n=1 Tax=Heyndrickxia acidicola TaxID=209389 RepID=A0ABU6MCM9_9BACI|nr:TerC family protein [Heyndrickxia acidicola]MED1202421.1 TerC family protein [Heyndrickxia acidicola]